jgi:hypothetical protein
MNTMPASNTILRAGLLGAALVLASLPKSVCAQEMDHSKMQMLMPAETPAPKKKSTKKPPKGMKVMTRRPRLLSSPNRTRR